MMGYMTKAEVDAATKKILRMKLNGFGGSCGAAAAKVNRDVFNGKGKYAAGVNEFYLDKKDRGIGHVVVSYGGLFWDSEGVVDPDDLLGWGMLDYDDSDYKTTGWTKKRAEKAILVEFDDEEEMLSKFPWNKPIPLKK
jgi:hypothetical protein